MNRARAPAILMAEHFIAGMGSYTRSPRTDEVAVTLLDGLAGSSGHIVTKVLIAGIDN